MENDLFNSAQALRRAEKELKALQGQLDHIRRFTGQAVGGSGAAVEEVATFIMGGVLIGDPRAQLER